MYESNIRKQESYMLDVWIKHKETRIKTVLKTFKAWKTLYLSSMTEVDSLCKISSNPFLSSSSFDSITFFLCPIWLQRMLTAAVNNILSFILYSIEFISSAEILRFMLYLISIFFMCCRRSYCIGFSYPYTVIFKIVNPSWFYALYFFVRAKWNFFVIFLVLALKQI